MYFAPDYNIDSKPVIETIEKDSLSNDTITYQRSNGERPLYQYQQLYSQTAVSDQSSTGTENEVDLSERTPNQVCINVPLAYVNLDENKEHHLGTNLFLIDFDILQSFIGLCFNIETVMVNEQVNLYKKNNRNGKF